MVSIEGLNRGENDEVWGAGIQRNEGTPPWYYPKHQPTRPPSFSTSQSLRRRRSDWEVGNPEKKESCFPRETSDIAFVIGTSNNNKIVPFVPLDSRSSLVPACGGDEGAAGMTVCCCYPRRGMDDWEL